ncbi:MAG: hypothetical protein NTV34_12120, partial [Proteobacteria bacterium]|nr:hypothetical protein [Pseudomonadota bacterium]
MKSCNPLNTYLTLLIAAMPVNFILLAGCKKNSSQQKSFVGLDADLDRDIAKGAAPSFVALQDWFKGDVPLDQDELRAGDVDYTVPETFDEEQWDEFSNDYKQGLIAYFQQQIDRVSEFQKVTKEKSAESTLKLNELLELETTEMYDIIRVLVDPDYKPVSNDLFAKLFAQDHLRNFVNRFSLNFLKRIYNQPGKEVSQRSILVGLEVEKGNFTKLLLAKYLDQQGATPAFVTSLSIACEKLTNFLTTLGAKFDRSCSLPPSGSLQLNSSISRKSAWNDLKGTGGHKFASSYGSMSGKNGYLAAARRPPRLSIFAGKDPSRGDPKGGGTQLTTLTDFKGSPKIEGASSFLASDWQG